jgi:glycosyltransferase involved in cell wall biosynthesis
MKILMLVPYLPTVKASGGQTRWYNLIKYLSKNHEITLYSLIKDDSERKLIPSLSRYCKKVRVFLRPKKPWTVRNILLSVLGPFPLVVIRNFSWEERREIIKDLSANDYDLIHTETFYVMPHLGNSKVPIVQVEQTMWHEVYRHYVDQEVPFIMKPFFLQDVLKVKFWERYYWNKADKLFAVSDEDREEMLKIVPNKEIGVIPNGVDCDYFAAKPVERISPPRIMYGVANFEWLQNQEATEVLVKEIWPKVRVGYGKKLKLWIVGRQMPKWLIRASAMDKDIEITENIPDARDAYRKATLMIAPIKGGGGTRLKILEAMAVGLPVISTSVGMAGLKIDNGKQAVIADTVDEMISMAVRLLKNPEKAEEIGRRGKRHVRMHFDWSKIGKLHEPVYEAVVRGKKNG